MIVSFAEITENKSGQTGQHFRRVAEYTKVLAMAMGMDEERANALSLASTMHDIGKLMIPSEILEKPGKLTDEEYAIIKTHTTYGGKLLENVEGEEMALARNIALEHHERPDGRGYPNKLKQISIEGRIVAVADVYDALTSKRSYKNAYYREHCTWLTEVKSGQVKWNIGDETSTSLIRFLPAMQTDIMLRLGEKTLIIDAKYYGETLQKQYDKYILRSAHIYQIFSYVKNLDVNHTGSVGGLLLYAKTDEDIVPDGSVKIDGNMIAAKTLDLNVDFRVIAAQLNSIATDYFGRDRAAGE